MNENQLFEITRKYHFYAAHRNHTLNDKCRNLHGHTYFLEVTFKSQLTQNGVSILFSDIDKAIEPIIKNLDHGLIISELDPLYNYLQKFEDLTGENLKMTVMHYESSVENLIHLIYLMINGTCQYPLIKISLQETTSAVVTLKFPL